jgi:hypothetical protein
MQFVSDNSICPAVVQDLVSKTHELRSKLLWSGFTLVRYQAFEVNILVYALCPLGGGE